MNHNENNFRPALGIRRLTPLYDFFCQLFIREATIKSQLIAQMEIEGDQKILDVGSGTGTLAIMIKQRHPQTEIFGIDPDSEIIQIAQRKAVRASLKINFDQGFASHLPYPDNFFDRVVSSFVIHHLKHDDKIMAFKEIHRVLKPNGELHIADLGKPDNMLARIASFVLQNFEEVKDNIRGLLPSMMREAGFSGVEISKNYMTIFGIVSLYVGRVVH